MRPIPLFCMIKCGGFDFSLTAHRTWSKNVYGIWSKNPMIQKLPGRVFKLNTLAFKFLGFLCSFCYWYSNMPYFVIIYYFKNIFVTINLLPFYQDRILLEFKKNGLICSWRVCSGFLCRKTSQFGRVLCVIFLSFTNYHALVHTNTVAVITPICICFPSKLF